MIALKPTKPASILVTDDEANIRLTLRTALESEGYLVNEASNGHEALSAVIERAPDLMVLDLNMPSLDGMAVLEGMKDLSCYLKPKVIVLTAYGSIPAAVKATRLGAASFLQKPVSPVELRGSVRSVLDEPAADFAEPAEARESAAGAPDYQMILQRARRALRLADYSTARVLLEAASGAAGLDTAAYYNLMGVLCESQRQWRLARKFYAKAIDAHGSYEPAHANMRRTYELQWRGRSSQASRLGDEPEGLWRAVMPEIRPKRN